jgi:hypothetical protein
VARTAFCPWLGSVARVRWSKAIIVPVIGTTRKAGSSLCVMPVYDLSHSHPSHPYHTHPHSTKVPSDRALANISNSGGLSETACSPRRTGTRGRARGRLEPCTMRTQLGRSVGGWASRSATLYSTAQHNAAVRNRTLARPPKSGFGTTSKLTDGRITMMEGTTRLAHLRLRENAVSGGCDCGTP